jgi:cell division protein FtsB
MQKKRNPWYWLSVALMLTVAGAYAWKSDLYRRYHDHLRTEAEIQAAQDQVDQLRQNLEASRDRVQDLDSDPLEVEASVRRIKRWARPGERVYRMEEIPSQGPSSPETKP